MLEDFVNPVGETDLSFSGNGGDRQSFRQPLVAHQICRDNAHRATAPGAAVHEDLVTLVNLLGDVVDGGKDVYPAIARSVMEGDATAIDIGAGLAAVGQQAEDGVNFSGVVGGVMAIADGDLVGYPVHGSGGI